MDRGLAWTWNGEAGTSDVIAALAIAPAVATATFAYRQLRIAEVDAEIVKYLRWLDSECAGVGVTGPACAHARKPAGRVTRP